MSINYEEMYKQAEEDRKHYHRKFCQERQLNIDSMPSQKLQKENEKLKQIIEVLKSACEFYKENLAVSFQKDHVGTFPDHACVSNKRARQALIEVEKINKGE